MDDDFVSCQEGYEIAKVQRMYKVNRETREKILMKSVILYFKDLILPDIIKVGLCPSESMSSFLNPYVVIN